MENNVDELTKDIDKKIQQFKKMNSRKGVIKCLKNLIQVH